MPADEIAQPSRSSRALPLLIPFVALLACVPLFRQGCSCGHDISFHLASWLDAAQQLRHGTLYPAWDTTAAWNAGEPRFVFYPPLSWMLGELLTLALPFRFVPAVYTWLALSAAGLAMFAVTRRLTSPAIAFVLAALYLANPYMLFTALERTAFAELLSAAWVPLLLFAALRDRPTVRSIAIPLALLWLTNAPAAVMGSYALAILAAVRVYIAFRKSRRALHLTNTTSSTDTNNNAVISTEAQRSGEIPVFRDRDVPQARASSPTNLPAPPALARTFLFGAILGLTLPAIYLIPAACERRFVQITMALVPGLSYPASFLFTHTGDTAHDHVLHQASLIAIALLALAFATLAALFLQPREKLRPIAQSVAALGLLTLIIALLLFPISAPIWAHAPELAFLQFPWRWLMVLAPTLILLLALLTRTFAIRISPIAAVPLAAAFAVLLSFPISHFFLQACPASDEPATAAELFRSGHGIPPTDEYTPQNADNDYLRSDSPAFWLSGDPQSPAPNTTPNPNQAQPDVDFGEPSPAHTLSQRPPAHFDINAPHPEYLILNLRDYPNWSVSDRSEAGMEIFHPRAVERDDGLVAVPITAGHNTIGITWRTGHDRILGALISLLSLVALLLLSKKP